MMELSCESVRYAEDTRPTSCKFVELHVLYVPGDQWNMKLNKAPAEATESFISAGFIRVYPDVTLKTLRGELGALLGAERSVNKFSFLKCVGRSLALVKSKQERDLKVKTFAPPYAEQPELYLLPIVENDSSVCSQSLTPDTSSSSSDHQIYYHPPKMCSLPTATKGLVKFPNIPQCSQQQPPPTPRLEEEEDEEEDDDRSYSSSAGEGGNEEDTLSSARRAEQGFYPLKPQQGQKPSQLVSVNTDKTLQRCEADLAQRKELPDKEGTCRNRKQCHRGNTVAGHSGVAESLEDRDSGFSLTDGAGKLKEAHTSKFIMKKRTNGATEIPAGMSRPVRCTTPPPSRHLATGTCRSTASPVFHTNREELTEEIKLVKEERKQLEWTRQELLRKGKDLLAQNRHRRNQARDSWKKKYFETKKATAPLEESLKNLRQELETFYNKLLHQLQAREMRGKPRRQGRSSTKNELIIQIMTETYEIDDLKRKIEDAKMKLVTEIKLRKQAATELRSLKAELAQKKSQSSHAGLKGNAARDRPTVQSSSI